jgi:hypothetical protein
MKIKAPRKSFADRRFAQRKQQVSRINYSEEYITGVALKRDGVLHSNTFRAHWELRASAFGINSPCVHKGYMTDECGFRTNRREFVSRAEAADIGRKNGQVSSRCAELLSSDVNFWPHPSEIPK